MDDRHPAVGAGVLRVEFDGLLCRIHRATNGIRLLVETEAVLGEPVPEDRVVLAWALEGRSELLPARSHGSVMTLATLPAEYWNSGASGRFHYQLWGETDRSWRKSPCFTGIGEKSQRVRLLNTPRWA